MNDDQMDEMLIQGVRDYNAPRGPAPREEMWRRIQDARAEARRAATPAMVPIEHARNRWLVPGVGIAAAALLATGIAIGRYFGDADPSAPVSTPVVASVPTAPADSIPTATSSSTPDDSAAAIVRKLRDETRKTDQRIRALASAEPAASAESNPRRVASTPSSDAESNGRVGGGPAGSAVGNTAGTETQSLAYRLVVLQHLAGSEAMITSFRSEARNGKLDGEIATWSRELLSTTRLLESSQASTDPVMKRLLDDLDLVISQIVQYTSKGTTNTEELDLIEQSITKRGVMSKLRSTIPSRNFPAGT